jgi:hypothetical protein
MFSFQAFRSTDTRYIREKREEYHELPACPFDCRTGEIGVPRDRKEQAFPRPTRDEPAPDDGPPVTVVLPTDERADHTERELYLNAARTACRHIIRRFSATADSPASLWALAKVEAIHGGAAVETPSAGPE